MKVALGTFACFCIENRLGLDLATGLQHALRHYVRRLESATRPLPLPAFACERRPRADEGATELELPVEPEIEVALLREARAQEVSMAQLLDHAVFVYMADLDSAGGLRAFT